MNRDKLQAIAPLNNVSRHNLLLRTFAVLLATILLAAPMRAEELPDSIVDVVVEGNETIPASVILNNIQTQPGRPVTNRQLREDKRSLMSTRLFYDVRERFEATPQGNILVFQVHERPIVQGVEFRGYRKVKLKQLEAWTGLRVGSPFDHIANREAVHRLTDEYKEQGFFFVRVELAKGSDPRDRNVVFLIDEGPKVRVRDRAFQFTDKNGKPVRNQLSWTLQRRAQDGSYGLAPSASRLKTKLVSKAAVVGLFGGLYKPETLPQDVLAIKQYYRGLGFFDVKVDAEPLFSEDRSGVRLMYTVNEGVPYKVRNIRVNGNHVIPTAQLRDAAQLHEGQFFNSLPLSRDVKHMVDQYGKRGHYFASVVPVPQFTEQPGIVDVTFEIDEDRPRYVRNVNVQILGDHPHTKNVVAINQLQVEPGDLADPFYIRRGQSRINGSGLFEGAQAVVVPVNPDQVMTASHGRNIRGQSSGYSPHWPQLLRSDREPNFGHSIPVQSNRNFVSPAPRPAAAPRKPAEPKPRPSVSLIHRTARPSVLQYQTQKPTNMFYQPPKTLLVSNFPDSAKSDTVIRGQNPGGFYQPPVPQRGDQLLQGSPYNNQFQALPPGWVDINVSANEGRTGRLMIGAGVNSDAGIVGSLVWDERNFDLFRPPATFGDIIEGRAWRGGGQRFRLEAAPGDEVSRYTLSWTDPYFLHSDFSFGVSGFYFNRFYPDWDETRLGGRLTLGKQFTPEWSVSGALRLEEIELNNPRTTLSSGGTTSVPDLEAVRGNNSLYTVRTSVTHDTRDSSMAPSDGHFIDFGWEQAFGEFNYPKLELDARRYFTMHSRPDGSGRHVLTMAGNLGWSGSETPVFERYYAGGFQSFRGFAFRGVTPRGEDNISVGGNWQMLGSAEYRVPLTADDMINVVVFSDVGTVEPDVSIENFRVTVGVGLRVVVPAMGPVPLAFDFGFPVRSAANDDERVFSFYVGINR